MKHLVTLSLLLMTNAYAQDFTSEAKALVADLKSSLMKNLSEKISKDGVVEAIPFCHANVKPIAKKAAKTRLNKYEFGRTSHKIRNIGNNPQPWADKYLKEFQGTFKGDIKKDYILTTLEDNKKLYMEPLYVQPQCLLCHGEKVSAEVKSKIQTLYPQDKATGFKVGEFRGFIWVKEK